MNKQAFAHCSVMPKTTMDFRSVTCDDLGSRGRGDVATIHVLRFRGDDRHCVEVVDGLDTALPREKKWIINISTQFGCPVGCLFCDAAGTWAGNLTAEEMLAQIFYVADRYPDLTVSCKKLKVHFARMGEPALNDHVLDVISVLPSLITNPDLWCCLATTGPRGSRPGRWFEHLFELKHKLFHGRFQLQFSINSTDESQRRRLMPVALLDMRDLAEMGTSFFKTGDRKVLLNFALADGIAFDPTIIIDVFDPDIFAVKLTPLNPTFRGAMHGFHTVLRSDREATLEQSITTLSAASYTVILSVGDGREDEIGSNCGQTIRMMIR